MMMWVLLAGCRPEADDSTASPGFVFGQWLGQAVAAAAQKSAIYGDSAIVCAGTNGLYVIDISDPTHPRNDHTESLGGRCQDIVHYADRLWVAVGTAGFQIIDLDPFFVAGSYSPGGDVRLVTVSPQLEWATCAIADGSDTRLLSYDVGVPDFGKPKADRVVASVTPRALLELDRSYAFADDGGHLSLLGTYLDTVGQRDGALALGAGNVGLAADDDVVWFLAGDAGLRGVRVTDPAQPTDAHIFTLGDVVPTAIAVADKRLYVAGRGVFGVFDTTDPYNPTQIGAWLQHPDLVRPSDIVVDAGVAVIADPEANQVSLLWVGDEP